MKPLQPDTAIAAWCAAHGVHLSLECEAETTPIRGNASAIDPATDRATEDMIHAQLADGNDWAWCMAHVVALHVASGLQGHASLGCCSYESEAAFRSGGYLEDMEREACADLFSEIQRMRGAVCGGEG